MASDLNRVTLIGRLGKDPEMRALGVRGYEHDATVGRD